MERPHGTGCSDCGSNGPNQELSPMAYVIGKVIDVCASTPSSVPPFNSNSLPLLIDNCCSKCVTNNKGDFVGAQT